MSDSKKAKSSELKDGSKKLYVKFMVSLRCKLIARSELEKLDLPYQVSAHGALKFPGAISEHKYGQLKTNLMKSGMVLLSQSDSKLVDKIITTIIEIIHYSDELPKQSFSELINSNAVSGERSILKIFSDVKGMSLLQFIVIQKIERAKELILYSDAPLSEIAKVLNYENEHYLSAQFKKITGLTPANFRSIKSKRTDNAVQHFHAAHKSATGTTT